MNDTSLTLHTVCFAPVKPALMVDPGVSARAEYHFIVIESIGSAHASVDWNTLHC